MNHHLPTKLLAGLLLACAASSSVQGQELVAEGEHLPAPYIADVEHSRTTLHAEDLGLAGRSDEFADIAVTVVTIDGHSRQYRPDADGTIVIDNLSEGPVGIVVTAPLLHAATVVYIRDAERGEAVRRVYLPLMRIAPEVVLKHVRGYLQVTPTTAAVVTDYRQWNDATATGTNPYQVHLQGDGSLRGRLVSVVREGEPGSDINGTNISLLSPSGEVLRAISDADGYFSLADVAPGDYGMIAAGPNGYVAHAVEVLPPLETLPAITPVSMRLNQPEGGAVLNVVPLPPPMLPALIEAVETTYGDLPPIDGLAGPPAPFPPGPPGFGPGGFGPGGGFGGGGGGGGIGGGLGGLAALAPLALLPVIIDELDDDDDDFFVPEPVSPARGMLP